MGSLHNSTIYDAPGAVHRHFVTVDGYKTHYLEAGAASAAPLVLVHGGNFQLGIAAERWYPSIVPLAQTFHVFAVDELGSGHTDAPRDHADLGDIRMRADHVLKFVEALNLGPVHLVGQSQGAWIVAYIAVKRPDLVRGLVLVDSASLALPDGGMNQSNIAASFATSFNPGTMVLEGLGPNDESVLRFMSTMIHPETRLPPGFMRYGVEMAERWLALWDKPWRDFWADGGIRNKEQYIVDGVELRDHLHRLQTAPLIIWGKDTVKGLKSGIDLFMTLPDAELHVYDKANHFLWIDQPERFIRSVTGFLLGQASSRSSAA